MADGFNRFNKRWASSAAVAAITENNANVGLDYIGDDPPTTALHNKMFQWLDEKDNYLFEQIRQAIADASVAAPTENDASGLGKAIRKVATPTFAGVQRNATSAEVQALALDNATITPAALKPLIDALTLGVATSVPAGAVMAFARTTPPVGWLACDGALYSRTSFSSLFSAVGTTFGTTTVNDFRVPDLRGVFVRGLNTTAQGWDQGRVFGSYQQDELRAHGHGLTLAAMPAHTHTLNVAAAGDHTHVTTAALAGEHRPTGTLANAGDHNHTVTVLTAGAHSHGGTTNAAGTHTHTTMLTRERILANFTPDQNQGNAVVGDEQSDGLQPQVSNSAGSHAHTITTSTAGDHVHGTTVSTNGNHTHSLSMDNVAAHTHTITVNSAGSHTHTGTTSAAGAFQPTGSIALTGGAETRPINVALLYCIKT
jgi:microcystin-dependent protein